MSANSIAISLRLVEKGVEKQTADAVAEELVDYNDTRAATKADVAQVEAAIKIVIGLVIGLYVGIAVLSLDKFIRG